MPVGFTPIYRIEKEGVDITSRFNDRLISIEVDLNSGNGNSDTVDITLDDRDWKIASPAVGRKIEVYLGYKEVGLAHQNVFEIKRVEYSGPPRAIRITGTSVGFIGALRQPKFENYEGRTLGEIIKSIARTGGVEALVEQGLAEQKIPFLNQSGQSSLHILQELERRYGAIAQFDKGKLTFIPRDKNQSVSGLTLPTLLLKPEHLAKWSVWHDQRGDYSGVRAAYVDSKTHQPVWIEEENSRAPTDEDGSSMRFPYRMPQPFQTEEEARAGMKAMQSRLNRSLGQINVTLSKGDPWIRANQLTLISGMRPGINGAYVAETVRHQYQKEKGLLTVITGKPPGGETAFDNGAVSDDKVLAAPQFGMTLGQRLDDERYYGPLAGRGSTAPGAPTVPAMPRPDPNLP